MALYNTQTKDEFEKLINSGRPVLVDFWAGWCMPCRAMAPALVKISEKDADIDIVKVDIEENQANGMLAGQYGVRSIPNMQLFKDGKVVEHFVGVTPEQVLHDALTKHK